MGNDAFHPLFLVALGIGLVSLIAVSLIYWHFKRKFARQNRNLDNWLT